MKRLLLILTAFLLCGNAFAKSPIPGVRTEWGVVAGVNYMAPKFTMGDSSASLKANPDFSAGIHMGLRIIGILGIQPEVIYSYNKIGIEDDKVNFVSDIKCNTLQVPVLLSLKLALVRFNIGPVFTVMDNPTYLDRSGEKVMFGRLNPTLSYTAGVSVCLFKHLLIDARVTSGFKTVENCLSYDISHDQYIKTTMFNAQLKIGVLF